MRKTSIVAAQPGWYSVTLNQDQSGLQEDAVLAWMFVHFEKEYQKERKWQCGELAPATPVTLYGDAENGCSGVVKDPNGTYWLQGDRLTQEKALDHLQMLHWLRTRGEEEAA
jgi:hypothetical protein